MGVVSEVLANHGAPHQIEHNGKVYSLRLIDEYAQGEFEKRWYERDCKGLKIQRESGVITEEKYQERLEEKTEAFRNGEYEMISPAGIKFLQTFGGGKMLLTVITNWTMAEIVLMLSKNKTEVLNKVQLIIAESFPGMNLGEPAVPAPAASASGSPDPNAQAPAA